MCKTIQLTGISFSVYYYQYSVYCYTTIQFIIINVIILGIKDDNIINVIILGIKDDDNGDVIHHAFFLLKPSPLALLHEPITRLLGRLAARHDANRLLVLHELPHLINKAPKMTSTMPILSIGCNKEDAPKMLRSNKRKSASKISFETECILVMISLTVSRVYTEYERVGWCHTPRRWP